jgi:hypothetical protein
MKRSLVSTTRYWWSRGLQHPTSVLKEFVICEWLFVIKMTNNQPQIANDQFFVLPLTLDAKLRERKRWGANKDTKLLLLLFVLQICR